VRDKPTPDKDITNGAAVGHTELSIRGSFSCAAVGHIELSTRGSFSCATVGIQNLLSWDLLFVLL
jgi:hypothetical protein